MGAVAALVEAAAGSAEAAAGDAAAGADMMLDLSVCSEISLAKKGGVSTRFMGWDGTVAVNSNPFKIKPWGWSYRCFCMRGTPRIPYPTYIPG